MEEINEVIEKLQATRNRLQVLEAEENFRIMHNGKGERRAIHAYSSAINDIDGAITSLVLLRMRY